MINYSKEMQILSGRSTPSERECELYEAVYYLGESFQSKRIKIIASSGADNDFFNVYYDGKNVFNVSTGLSDEIRLYFGGKWEDEILERYHLFK